MNQILDRLDQALTRVGYTYGALAYNLAHAKLPPGVSFEQFLDDVVGNLEIQDKYE